jgi:hypothetical protein
MLRAAFLKLLQHSRRPRRAPHLQNPIRLTLATLLCCSVVTATFAQSSGPVAAYSFDAGSGTSVSDVTGHNNTVSLLNGPTWRTGKYGNAVTFDGVNDFGLAGAAQPALNLTGRSFTLSAWVNPRSNSGWQLIVDKPYTSGHSPPYFDWSMHRENSTGRLNAFLGCEGLQRPSNSSIPLNTWTHVAVTYDGAALRHYINGVLDRSTPVSCNVTNTNSRPIRIGANGAGGEVMNGAIDDVRIYDRPLSVAEIQTDMASPLGSATPPPDTAAPSVTLTAPSNGATVSSTVTVTASASDDVAVLGVRFKVDGIDLGAEDQSAPYSVAWNTTQLSNGNHTLTATARDATGNVRTSSVVTVNVNNTTAPPAQSGGPLAAYSFNAGSGTTVADVSGNSNTLNLVNGAVWGGGKYGNAVLFDGSNDYAVAAAANGALNLTGHNFTLSAWVNPRSNSGWQLIVDKPYTSGHSPPYFDWSMHRENSTGRLNAFLGCEGLQRPSNSSVPLNTWTHVAVTYDGTALRHYINGVLDRSTSVSCNITNTNSRPIRVGANGAGTETMNGLVDDVRIYNRTLSGAEIQADMGTSLSGDPAPSPDTIAPSAAITAPANGAAVSGTATVSANASDNVGVVGVQFKVNGTNYGSEDQSAPYSVAWNTTQLANGNHTLTAAARDAAGNVATSAGVTVNVTNSPSTPPTVSLTANPTSVPSGSSSTLSWTSTNATSCVASGAWSGNKATSGSQSTGALGSTSTYSLNCTGTGGSTSRSVTVTVTGTTPAPTLTLSASPTSVPSGGSANLNWSSSNATSCTASGAWSGTRPTSGTASTGALTNTSNTFTLTCSGPGGSTNRSVSVTVQGSGTLSGLDFPGSAATSGTIRFRFTNPLLAIYPATYIWRVYPRQQAGYYTTFFWGNDGEFDWGGVYGADTFYGAHPYPPGGSTGTTHKWEIAALAHDFLSSEDVVYNRWYTQALRVWSDGSGKHHEFYWDLPNTSRVIRVDLPGDYGNINPPNPALTWGDAPWAPSNEIMNGVIRGIQIYSTSLSVSDILSESSAPMSTAPGTSNIWYLNLNPTPTDISDKSGQGHHPQWVGSERPRLWSDP